MFPRNVAWCTFRASRLDGAVPGKTGLNFNLARSFGVVCPSLGTLAYLCAFRAPCLMARCLGKLRVFPRNVARCTFRARCVGCEPPLGRGVWETSGVSP